MEKKKSVDWVLPVAQPYRVSSDASQHLSRSDLCGIDFYSTSGDWTIRSVSDGVIETLFFADPVWMGDKDRLDSLGNFVVVRYEINGLDVWVRYCHLDQIMATGAGQRVKAGQAIGVMGTTGISEGPHLHLDFWMYRHEGYPYPLVPAIKFVPPWPSAPWLLNANPTKFLLSKGIDCVNLGGAKWIG